VGDGLVVGVPHYDVFHRDFLTDADLDVVEASRFGTGQVNRLVIDPLRE
jgi:hypothetical protein